MSQPKPPAVSRRTVFAGAVGTGALVGAAALLPTVRTTEPAAAVAKAKPDEGGGYQVTEHVLRYYQTTRV
jgi:hypothetical protein